LLFSVSKELEQKNIGVILVYVSEAHSKNLWPIGAPFGIELPESQKNLDERISRAKTFAEDNNCPYSVYVDTWDNNFDETFQTWPDKFYLINSEKVVTNMSRYDGEIDALVVEDYSELLLGLAHSTK